MRPAGLPDGPDVFRHALETAVDALDFKLDRLLEQNPSPTVEGTRRIVDAILGVMAAGPRGPQHRPGR